MKKKKILHLITGLELGGGAENMLFQLLPRMQEKLDNRVCVITGRGEIGKKLEVAGVSVYYLELKSIFDIGIIFRYKKVLSEFKPDVQVNYLIHADIFGRIFGKIFGVKKIIPYIRNIHRNKKILMFLDRATLFLADFVLTNSETARKYYIEKMGAKPDKITCIPNGIDLSKIENLKVDREEKLKEIGMINLEASIETSKKLIIIGTVARLEKQKDIPTLVKAFKMVQGRHPEARLLIVGHGSQKENIRRLIKELNIASKTVMLEKRTDNLELISVMDIFVLPSLNEGMSNALLEAMALKRLIITSDIEENKELIKNGENGLIFKVGDVNELNNRLVFLIDNLLAKKGFREKSAHLVVSNFSLSNILYNILKQLNNL